MQTSARAGAAVVGLLALFSACAGPKPEGRGEHPTDATLEIEGFDVAEAGWGDAPLPVHYIWRIRSSTGRFACKLDVDGDGTFDREIADCRADTTGDALGDLPTFTFTKIGEHRPKLVVVAGQRTVEATTTIYANHVDFAPGVFFPEKTPGFVSASASWPDEKTFGILPPTVVLTFDDPAKVPSVTPGTVVWGASGFGYLMKVKSATPAGATLTLEGEPADITEAIENGFVGARDVQPSYNGAQCLFEGCKDAEFEALAAPLPALDGGTPSSGTKSLGAQKAPLIIGGKGQLGLKVKFKYPKDIEHSLFVGLKINKFLVEIGFFKLKRFTLDTNPGFKYEINVQKALFKGFQNLGTIPLAPVPIPPFYVVPTLVPERRWDAKLKAAASIEAALPFKANYDSESDGWTWDVAPNASGSMLEDIALKPEVSVGATAKIEFVPKFEALVMGAGGPYVAPVLSLNGDFKIKNAPTPNPGEECDNPLGLLACSAFKVGLGGEGGLDAPWLAKAGPASSKAYKGPIKLFEVGIAEAQFYEKCFPECKPPDGGVLDGGSDATLGDSSVDDTGVPDSSEDATLGDTSVSDSGEDVSTTDSGGGDASDGGADLSGITPECFEGTIVELPATGFYAASTMRLANVQEVKGGIAAYPLYLATPEVGDQSTKVPANAKVFTFGDPATDSGTPGFPSSVAGRFVNRYGRSNLLAVWINETTGRYEWMFNVTGGHYSISGGGSATWRQYQFIHDGRANPQYIFKTYGSSDGTIWSYLGGSSYDTGSGIAAAVTFPKECFQHADFALTPVSVDFGAVAGGGSSADATFVVSNVGSATTSGLSIALGGADGAQFAITSGSCGSGTTLSAGASCTVNVRFIPSSATSAGNKSAQLTVSAANGGSATSALGGKVIAPGLTISPTPHDFGMRLGGTSSGDATFTVSNPGSVPTTPIAITLLGGDASSFAITGGTCVSGTTVLAAAASCTVTAKFAPGATALYGAKATSLQASAATGGVATAALRGGVLAPPGLLITPTPKSFGSVGSGASSEPITFTVKNGIGAAITGPLAISFSGTDPTQFAVSGGTCVSGTTTLAGGKSCTIVAQFKPTAAGAKSATLQVAAAPGGTVWAAISGTGM